MFPLLKTRRDLSRWHLRTFMHLQELEVLTSEYIKCEMLWLEVPYLVAEHTGGCFGTGLYSLPWQNRCGCFWDLIRTLWNNGPNQVCCLKDMSGSQTEKRQTRQPQGIHEEVTKVPHRVSNYHCQLVGPAGGIQLYLPQKLCPISLAPSLLHPTSPHYPPISETVTTGKLGRWSQGKRANDNPLLHIG